MSEASRIFSTRPEPDPRGPGQESAWEYPRPPRLEPTARRLRVVLARGGGFADRSGRSRASARATYGDGDVIAETTRGLRVLETSHPPTYYFPLGDVTAELVQTDAASYCEFKGHTVYFDVRHGDRVEGNAAWGYDRTTPAFDAMHGHVGFYAGRMDACFVDDEQVVAQPGDFYGGWITRDIVGPFKGGPGTRGW